MVIDSLAVRLFCCLLGSFSAAPEPLCQQKIQTVTGRDTDQCITGG